MITIEFDNRNKSFIIKCPPEYNKLVMGMTEKRFRKSSGTWSVPALRENKKYMHKHLNNPQMYSQEALREVHKIEEFIVPLTNSETVQFPVNFPFKIRPRSYQMEFLNRFYGANEAGMFFPQGLGKTFTSINLSASWAMVGDINAVLVICPSALKATWEEELSSYCPIPYTHHTVRSGKYKKTSEFLKNQDGFQWMIAGIEGLSQGLAIKYIREFVVSRNCLVIVDESSRIKTPGKIRTNRCIELGAMATKRLILSGTSVTQGIEDLFTQMKFLNSEILGFRNFTTFKARYCITKPMEVARNRWVDMIVGYKNKEEFISKIKPFVMRVEKEKVEDLPEKVFVDRHVEMNTVQRKLYHQMEEEMRVHYGGIDYRVTSTLERDTRLSQITGGHYPFDDGELVKAIPIPGPNPKIKSLMSEIETFPDKIIVWCKYRAEIELIKESFEHNNIPYVIYHGGCSEDEKNKAVRDFRGNNNIKVFLATNAAAYGLTLIEASCSIYYSLGYSLETYAQSLDRIHRLGQKKVCNYIHLICDKTIDTDALRSIKSKQNVADSVYQKIQA